MATSSITKNFIISGKEQVEMFADAIEASANNRPVRIQVSSREITDESELIEFMEKWEEANVGTK
jgi:dihydrodipicolinate synthase/N-acetylneuraminate lyase